MNKKITYILVSILLVLGFLEGFSILYWKLVLQDRINASQLTIYDYEEAKGEIIPNQQYVIPIKKNYVTKWETSEFNVNIIIDANGLRNSKNQDLDWKDVPMVFMGDSFTFGHGVEEDERYSDVCAECLHESSFTASFINLSYINGWQPEHYEYFLRANTEIKPKYLIMGVYLGNDFYSDIKETEYDFETNKLGIPRRKINQEGLLILHPEVYRFGLGYLREYSHFIKLFLLYSNNYRIREKLYKSTYLTNVPNSKKMEFGHLEPELLKGFESIVRTNQILKSRGTKLIVVLIPQNFYFEVDNPHISPDLIPSIPQILYGPNLKTKLLELLEEKEIIVLDSSESLDKSHFFPLDGHWNAKGHGKIGFQLCKLINRIRPEGLL